MLLAQLPAGLQASLPAAAHRPLQLMMERFLERLAAAPYTAAPEPTATATSTSEATNDSHSCWLGAVVGAYVTAVVLRKPPGPEMAAAERHLTSALAGLQQAAAVLGLLQEELHAAAAAAACNLRCLGSTGSAGQAPCLAATERRQLLEEALQHLTCSEGLELAAAAQLLAQRADEKAMQQAQQHTALEGTTEQGSDAALCAQPAGPALAVLVHSPPTALELELLCLVALLPCWEAVLQQLTRPDGHGEARSSWGHDAAGSAAAAQAVQLLCSACGEQPEGVLAQHPALMAEVCRRSFRLTCAYATLLVQHQRAAAEGTRAAAAAARWRVAHAVKHPDHVSSYLLAKGCTV